MSKSFCLKYFWNYQKMQFLFSWYIFFAFIRDNFPLSIHYTEYLTTLNDILILIWSFYILSELGKCFKELLKGLDDLKYICSIYVKIYKCIHGLHIYGFIIFHLLRNHDLGFSDPPTPSPPLCDYFQGRGLAWWKSRDPTFKCSLLGRKSNIAKSQILKIWLFVF